MYSGSHGKSTGLCLGGELSQEGEDQRKTQSVPSEYTAGA